MKRHLSATAYVFLGAIHAVVLLTDATLHVRDTDITTRGKTFRVVCSVTDEPFVGWFSKNGKVKTMISGDKLTNSHMYVLKNGNHYTLIIQDVTVADGGTFQCRGSQHTNNFTLYVEFYSKEFPKSQKLNAGENSTLKCAADGYPYPIFKWYKNNERIDLSKGSYNLLKNGSLALTNVHEDDAGNYTCLITQLGEIGRQREERKQIEVTVFGPPRPDLSLSTKVVYSYIGNQRRLQFRCYFWGYPIPQMKITTNNKPLSKNDVEHTGQRSISGFVRTEKESDFGSYICEAENDYGTASHTVEIIQAGRPSPPQNLTVTKECDHLTVTWRKPQDDGGISVIQYTLELEQDSLMLHTVIVGSVTTRYTFTRGIRPKTVYELRIKARSEAQYGQWASLKIASGVCPPSGEMFITNKVTQLNSTRFTVKWTKPKDGGDPNITYIVEFSKRDAQGNFVRWIKRKDIQQQEYDITELERGAEYEIRVTAVNRAGQSDEQAVKRFRVRTDADVKPKPGGLDMIYDIKINCTSPNIYLNFSVKDSPGLDKASFRLRDSSCTPYERTATNVLLKTALDACGTTSQHSNKTVAYYNSVFAKVKGTQETDVLMFPFSCTFGREKSIGIPSFQTGQRVMVYQAGFGNFTFLMNLYKDKKYESPYQVSEYPVTVQPSSTLYCQAELKASDAHLVMLLTTCTATPSMNTDDAIRYPFIQRGCPADDSVSYTYQHSSRQRFQLVSFRFKQESQFIYLHCEVLVCQEANHSRCIQGCRRSVEKRSLATDSNTHFVTLGPIQLERKKKFSKKSEIEESKGSILLLLLAIIGTIFGTSGIFIMVVYILRKTVPKPHETPHPQQV